VEKIKEAKQFLTFGVGPFRFCAPADTHLGIIMPPPVTKMPLTSGRTAGSFLFRDNTALAINMRRQLGLPSARQGSGLFIVAQLKSGIVGFWADEVADIVPVSKLETCQVRFPGLYSLFKQFVLINDTIVLQTDFELLFAAEECSDSPTDFFEALGVSEKDDSLAEEREADQRNGDKKPLDHETEDPASLEAPAGKAEEVASEAREELSVRAPKPRGREQPQDKSRSTPSGRPAKVKATLSARPLSVGKAWSQERGKKVAPQARQIPEYKAEASSPRHRLRPSVTSSMHQKERVGTPPSTLTPRPDRQRQTFPEKPVQPPQHAVSRPPVSPPMSNPGAAEAGKKSRWQGPLIIAVFVILLLVGPFLLWPEDYSGTPQKQKSLTEIRGRQELARPILNEESASAIEPQAVADGLAVEEVMATEELAGEMARDSEAGPEMGIEESSRQMAVAAIEKEKAKPSAQKATELVRVETNDFTLTIERPTAALQPQPRPEPLSFATRQSPVEPESVLSEKEALPQPEVAAPASEELKPQETQITTTDTIITHIVLKNDTLWDIAEKHLGNPLKYKELARLSRIKDPHWIYPGDIIRIIKKAGNGEGARE